MCSTFPRGSTRLACRGCLVDAGAQPSALEVVDEDDVWLEGTGAAPDCETSVLGISDNMRDAPGYPTPAEAVRRQFSDAFEPGDVLEQLGYRESKMPAFSLVPDGNVLWSFAVRDYGEGWLVESDSKC